MSGTTTQNYDDYPVYWPYDNIAMYMMDHISDLQTSTPKCKESGTRGEVVYQLTVGDINRCFIVYTPPTTEGSIPLLMYAHQSGSFLAECGGTALMDNTGATWHDIADKYGFAFVCIEAQQYSVVNNVTGGYMSGGMWDIPTVFNSRSGNNCAAEDSVEHDYLEAVFSTLKQNTDYDYDLSRFFVWGCSQGSAFVLWQVMCLYGNQNTVSISSFATHSTGIKLNNDGLEFPADFNNPEYMVGECPGCDSWPVYLDPVGPDLKICIFDNEDDPYLSGPVYYESSKKLAEMWEDMDGNREPDVRFYAEGGHCGVQSFEEIADCLDDGTGRLWAHTTSTTRATTTEPPTQAATTTTSAIVQEPITTTTTIATTTITDTDLAVVDDRPNSAGSYPMISTHLVFAMIWLLVLQFLLARR